MSLKPLSNAPIDALSLVQDSDKRKWTPLYQHDCAFTPEIFNAVMLNLIRNPNINSTHLFRADIHLERLYQPGIEKTLPVPVRIPAFEGFKLKKVIACTLIPRNMLVDKPLDETCLFYEKRICAGDKISMVTYMPHIASAAESPFYHPAVHGISFLHFFSPATQEGKILIYYSFFDSEPRSAKLERTAQRLLAVLHKHGQGILNGYVKRVHHDVILPQATVQNTYSRLKAKYSRKLIEGWVGSTDPVKHVFEDLGIAAFLIELWKVIYKDENFPGFVDIGCGNGLLVHILREEGYSGWGFDARKRRSWEKYSQPDLGTLKELILVPAIVSAKAPAQSKQPIVTPERAREKEHPREILESVNEICNPGPTGAGADKSPSIHDGLFLNSPFIISNHADELTPWTALLATLSKSPFLMIPCCSHDLSGRRFRAPPLANYTSPPSAYASLVAWVSQIARDCGWQVEEERLRIPSTRNIALIGRVRTRPYEDIDLARLIEVYGGAVGWEENALKLGQPGSIRNH